VTIGYTLENMHHAVKRHGLGLREPGRSVYGMIRNVGRLLDDPRLKQLVLKHDERLAKQCYGRFPKPSDVFSSLFPHSACTPLSTLPQYVVVGVGAGWKAPASLAVR